ncbi:hypothetical protein [Kiloniella sp. b19]|uniref:hypothetical protein n=1 Tax=Kiloniella sp. GXU_MW_B19 TaxID=3141326 RepID=UPI0031DB4EEB
MAVCAAVVLLTEFVAHSDLRQKHQNIFRPLSLLLGEEGSETGPREKLRAMPRYDSMWLSGENGEERSLSGIQQRTLILALEYDAVERECSLTGLQPSRFLWAQQSGASVTDSYAFYADRGLLYRGMHLDAWKAEAQGQDVVCFELPEEIISLLSGA